MELKHSNKGFLIYLIIYTIVLAAAGYLVSLRIPEKHLTPVLAWIYVFFFAVTILVHIALKRIAARGIRTFVNYFMLLTMGKILFYLTIVLLYALLNKDDAVPFILAFFILYVFFTGFEVVMSLRKKQGRDANPAPDRNG